ncbi:MAG: hypothetical protein FWF10_10080 [Clostridiales bacterium]|nr:hypothetical protein [Clostridiales bacterium]
MKKYEAPDYKLLVLTFPESILVSDWVPEGGGNAGPSGEGPGEGTPGGDGEGGWGWGGDGPP